MPDIQKTVFGLLLLVPQFCNVILPERWASVPTIPASTPSHLQDWSYPYPKDTRCSFPYIWQPSVGRCCYPVFNCEPGSGIDFCREDRGNDLCAKCKNSSKQYHLVHSFDGVNATCFNVSESDEFECIVGETLPARGSFVFACGTRCECNPNNCYYGDDPCRCQKNYGKCKSNQQMNKLTGGICGDLCEACPWYGYKLKEDCDACSVNESLWMSGPTPTPNVTVPPTPNVTVPPTPSVTVPPTPVVTLLGTTIEGNLTKIITEETSTKTTTALLPETENDVTIQMVMIIGVVVIVVFFIAGMVVMHGFQKRTFCRRSGAISSQYTSISQVPFPPIVVANQGPATQYQEESETSHLINNIPETNIQQSNGYIIPQSVSSTHHHLVNHEVADIMDSPKSSESSNDLGVHGHISERNQSASSNNESPENLTAPGEGTLQNDDLDQTSQFKRCPSVGKGHSWSFSRDSVADNDNLTVARTLSGYENTAQNTVPQAICTGDVDKRTDDDISKRPVKEFIKLLPLNSSAARGPDLETPNHEGETFCKDSRIPNEEPRIPSEEGHHVSPQFVTTPLSPTSPSSSSPLRPFLNRLISSSTDRPTAKVPPMRQDTQNQRQDEVTVENNEVSMSTDSSTDPFMPCGVVHFPGTALPSDESLESSIPFLNSCCEDNPPSFSYITNSPNTASHTQVGKTEPKRPSDLRSATRNGSHIQMMANQSRGGPDGASVPSHHRVNRVMEPRQVFETEVKEPQQSEETDPKTLLSSTQERDRNELESQDSDSEDDPQKIGFKVNLAEDQEKLRDICEGLSYPSSASNATLNSSDDVQGKTLRKDFHAMGANASHKEIDFRNVSLHNDDQILYNKWSFSSELEHEENKLNSAAKSKLDIEETSDSYHSLQDKEDVKKETKSLENGGKDGGFRDSKSSLEEIEKEAGDFISDTDPAVDEISSDPRSSPSEDEEVCLNGDAKLNRDLQQPSRDQIDVHNEFNSSSLSVNSDESGIDIEEQTIQHLQDS